MNARFLLRKLLLKLEIIFINDGGSDKSLQILQQKQNKDTRIKIVNSQINNGPEFARNKGIQMANGKYILFVDADDYLYPDAIIELVNSQIKDEAEILIYNASAFDDDTGVVTKSRYFYIKEEYFFNNNIIDEYYSELLHCTSCALKMYDTSFLIKNNIFFPVSVYGEDVEFWIKCFLKVQTIRYADFIGYARRYRKG